MSVLKRVKGGISYRCEPNGKGIYYIYWTEGRRSRRTSTRQTNIDFADAFLDEWLKLRDDGEVEGRGAGLTCREIWGETHGKNGADDNLSSVWKRLDASFGDLRLSEVTREVERRHIAARLRGKYSGNGKPPARSTLRLELARLRSSWSLARAAGLISKVDIPELDPLPEGSAPRERWLSDDELRKVCEAAASLRAADGRLTRIERFIWLARETAARRTAILELKWSQVDFEIGVIHYLPEGRQQTSKRRASVPISSTLLPVLHRAYSERINDFVLDKKTRLQEPFDKVMELSGVEGVTPHVLRHSAATHMARRGVSLWIIAKVLGNSVEQVEKVYAKFAPDFARSAVEAISGVESA
ncbi:site-specific integrase [Polycladidibacter hongkongensis]|uniref:site-specific integrase n=1 Tax=Polycladidibacter hongkongensis TaxID=1647556 RepID=UPI000831F71B|nr:site-specific integrase [Pseudovibrio hongkongensis]